MNNTEIKGKWKQIKGNAKQQYGVTFKPNHHENTRKFLFRKRN